jgi:hypothetical protein
VAQAARADRQPPWPPAARGQRSPPECRDSAPGRSRSRAAGSASCRRARTWRQVRVRAQLARAGERGALLYGPRALGPTCTPISFLRSRCWLCRLGRRGCSWSIHSRCLRRVCYSRCYGTWDLSCVHLPRSLRSPVELEPKRPSKGRKRAFGRIGLGSLQSCIADLAREFSAAFSGPMSLPDNGRPVRLDERVLTLRMGSGLDRAAPETSVPCLSSVSRPTRSSLGGRGSQ